MIEATSATVRNRTSASWRSFDMCYPDLQWVAPARRRLPLRRNCTQVQEATLGADVTGGEVHQQNDCIARNSTRRWDRRKSPGWSRLVTAPDGAGRVGRAPP